MSIGQFIMRFVLDAGFGSRNAGFAMLLENLNKYYTAGSLNNVFQTVPDNCIIEYLARSGIRQSDLNDQISYTIPELIHPRTDVIILTSASPQT